jgi:hypothetical protein
MRLTVQTGQAKSMIRAKTQADDVDALAAHYPLSPSRFAHALASHPLLSLDALARAALMMDPADIERRFSKGDVGTAFTKLDGCELGIDAHIQTVASNPCWIMLAKVEQLPAYRTLIDDVLANFQPMVEAATGPMRNPVGFIFISAQGSITPFHFDPEYNLFFQIAGTKNFTTFPAAPPFMTDAVSEDYHVGGNNMLRWDPEWAAAGTCHILSPGDGLFVPYKSPHWVQVGGELSISLSITWKSDWAHAQEYGHRFNAQLRRLGMAPRPLAPWPATSRAKAAGGRVISRLGLPK